jgi:protein involved in polysaccharide export with SLBB domain
MTLVAALLVGLCVTAAMAQTGTGQTGSAQTGTTQTGATQTGTTQDHSSEDRQTPSSAAQLPPNPDLPLAGPVDPATYVLGPGDVLQLQMWGRLSRSAMLTVGPEGYVLAPGSGSMNVKGRTLAAVRDEVLGRLRAQFSGVSMDFRLARPRSFRIYLTGQVRNPSPVPATGASRVNDVLTPGILLEDGSRRRIEVRHVDGSVELADLEMFLRTGNASVNPLLRDGDIIYVPVATEFVWAQGAIARPGSFELGPHDSLLTLFHLAGEPVPSADANRALLIRWRQPFEAESLWFGLGDVYEGKANPELREGDRLYVYHLPKYHQQQEATIAGEIARPGVYPISEGRHRISDLVTAAGGFLGNADLAAIRIFHSTRASDTDPEFERLIKLSRDQLTDTEYEILRAKLAAHREDFRVDWFRLRQAPELDILLRGGDVVRVDPLITSVRVDGEVRRPGIVEFEARRTVQGYVALAGGYSERAARGRIRITRSVTGQSLRARDVPAIAPGDLIWVPERSDVSLWEHLQTLITVAAQVATLVIVVRAR